MADNTNEAYVNAQVLLQDNNGNPTSKYSAYLKYQTEYNNEEEIFNQAYQDAQKDPVKLQTWPVTGAQLQNKVNQAFNNWIALGNKNEIESALIILEAQATGNNKVK